jgi:hypothetical protein
MKNKLALFIVTAVTLLSSPILSFAQAPLLGTVANFVLYTITGAVGNTGVSSIVGNVGTNNGAITGFVSPSTLVGSIDSGNAVTVQCKTDLLAAYTQLYNTAPTSTTHTPSFGTGETLFAGVYSIAAAGSVAGNLTLDAQGNSNAIFIFKFGGAFTTGAASTIILLNGAKACNVFWEAQGAISMAAVTTMKGTLIANNGAISMGAGGMLDGRMFSTTGAVSVYSVTIPVSSCFILPVELVSFTGVCENQNAVLNWSTALGTNDDYFIVERSIDGINWQVAGKVAAIISSASLNAYSFTDNLPGKMISYYRLMQMDFSGNYSYGNIIYIENCSAVSNENLVLFPNPSKGKFSLYFAGDKDKVNSIDIFNSSGQKIYRSIGFQPMFDLTNNIPGMYFVRVNLNSNTIEQKIMLMD